MADRSVKIILGVNVSGFVSKMKTAEKATVDFGKKGLDYAAKHEQNLTKLSNRVGMVGIGLTAVAGLAVKAAIDWESAWAGVTKTVDATPAQLAEIEQGLRGLATSMPESHKEIAAVAEAAGQLGIKSGSIVAFTKTMVQLGDTTNLTADEAATSIAQLMNVMQSAPGDVDNLGSALVALGNNGASTERDIVQMAQRIGGAGTIVGLSVAEVLSLSNALASTGIEVEAGGSSISRVLIDISKSVSTGGDSLSKWAEVAGMSAEQFAGAWKDKPAAALTSFVEGLGKMNDEGGDVFSTLDELGQQGIRTTAALLNLANGGDLLRKSFQTGDVAWERNNALVKEAEKRYDTAAAKSQIAMNGIKDNAIDMGQALLPVVAKVAEAISGLTDAFGSLPGPVKSGLGVLAGVGGVALLAAAGLVKATISIAAMRTEMAAIQASTVPGVAGMGKFAKVTMAAAIALAAFYAAGKAGPGSESTAGTGKFAGALLAVAQGSKGAKASLEDLATLDGDRPLFTQSTSSVKGLKDAFATLDDGSFSRFIDHITPGDAKFDNATKAVKKIDDALVSLVSSGAADEAADAFDHLGKTTGKSSKELKEALPGYSEALANLSVESKLAGKSTEDLGDSLKGIAPLSEEAQKALDEAKEATYDSAMGFLDMSANLDKATYSFKGWIKGLEDMAKAQADWADNLILATNRGVSDGVIDELKAMGPAGKKALADLANASDEEIDRVNKAFESAADTAGDLGEVLDGLPSEAITSFKSHGAKDAITTAAAVAHEYGMQPPEVRTILKALNYTKPQIDAVVKAMKLADELKANPKLTADTKEGRRLIREMQAAIDNLRGKTVTINTRHTNSQQNAINAGREEADGGILSFYANGGIRENHVAQIAPAGAWRMWAEPETGGEAYIPLAPSKRARSKEIWMQTGELLGMQAMANGGVMGGKGKSSGGYSASLVGARIAIDKNGLASFVDGRIDVVQSGNDNYRASKSRAGSK